MDRHEAALDARRWGRRALTILVMAGLVPLMGGCQPPNGPGSRFAAANATCPRPQGPIGVAPQFNAQEQDVRFLRRQAFHGDFFAQIDLARRYSGRDARERNLEDPVEAAVWYELALSNPDGYSPIVPYPIGRPNDRGPRKVTDCRTAERRGAYYALERLLNLMSSDERQDVRNRVIYVLSTQGAYGFRTLARLHDVSFGPFGDPPDNSPINPKDLTRVKPPASATLFTRNDVDVYLYNYLATQAGDVAGYVMLKDFERSSPERAALAADAQATAVRWVPPYEFYPPEAPASGVPHSDESDAAGEAGAVALGRINELPFIHVGRALTYLRVTARPPQHENQLGSAEASAMQGMLGRPGTGRLSPLEKVRAIQYAAVNGSPNSQLVLAVMYAEGVGVPRDYARAFHWFSEAEKQGSPEAKYAMSTYFSLGVAGIADQDRAQAVVYQIDSALSGFSPSVTRLRNVLAQVSGQPQRDGYGSYQDDGERRPVREPYGQGGGYGPSQGPGGGYGPGPSGGYGQDIGGGPRQGAGGYGPPQRPGPGRPDSLTIRPVRPQSEGYR
jgi:hypothetical protein